MIRPTRMKTRAAWTLGLAAIVLGLAVAPALGAPQFGVTLTHEKEVISQGDERMEYTVSVKNTAPSAVSINPGDQITCDANVDGWFNGPTSFSIRWLSNGDPATAAAETQLTPTSRAYVVQPADIGHPLQCLVNAENAGGANAAASLPQVVSTPATPPPAYSGSGELRPSLFDSPPISISATEEEFTCTPPGGGTWTGSPTWIYQWLRNGQEIAGATANTYVAHIGPGEEDRSVALQCEVKAENAGGAVVAISNGGGFIGPFGASFPPRNDGSTITGPLPPASPNQTSGPVTLELELPEGGETFVYKFQAGGWSCAAQPASGVQHAKAICTSSAILAPGASYDDIEFFVHPDADEPGLAIAKATVTGGGSPVPGIGEDVFTIIPNPWGIEAFSIKVSGDSAETTDSTTAGGHPITGAASFSLARHRSINQQNEGLLSDYAPVEHLKSTFLDTPRGFVGNALTVPEPCPSVEAVLMSTCPASSAVGKIELTLSGVILQDTPIYSVEPEFGVPAQFVFNAGGNIYIFIPRLRADEGYAISFEASPAQENALILAADPALCSFGLKPSRTECREPGEPGANPIPLITNPTRCSGPPPAGGLRVNSWEHPGTFVTKDTSLPQVTECENVKFEPEVKLTATNHQADSPTGLDVEFKMPTDGLFEEEGVAQAMLDNAVVTFPKGMTVNPASANGLGACSLAQIKFHSNDAEECPESSRIGTVDIETPLIRKPLTGSVYLAKQNENPFQSAFGLYMSFFSARDGVRVKVAGKLVPDPQTGQLVSTFAENPEWPFSKLVLHFNSGPHAPLINPPACGSYAIHSELSPWSAVNPANPTADEIVAHDDTYQVTSGPNGSACPNNTLDPKLKAGVKNPTAGTKTPFVFSLSREDGTQRFAGVDVANPKGLTAYLKGIPYCPESALASISGAEEAGRGEIASPSCPAASQVGTSSAGAGAGPFPYYVETGKVYLAGPYKGAPVSLAVVTPAVAGPYDLGSVLVRVALHVDPVTSQVIAKADPIPTVLHGIVLDVRDIRLALDRPGFTATPTSCEPNSIDATVLGQEGAVAKVSNRFQVGGCENLGFKPKISFRLFGGTHRGSHPRLRAIVKTRPGDANFASASTALPHSAFLDQGHIKTVCTRVQYAAKQCPPGSIYGFAEATTPLLDQAVKGPVYLRSSSHQLPDLVMALRGPDSQPIEIEVAGTIDSIHGGIRATFETLPDQPVTQFTLTMQGGKKGLLVNSKNICASTSKATATFTGQNGKRSSSRPLMENSCSKSAKKKNKTKKKHSR